MDDYVTCFHSLRTTGKSPLPVTGHTAHVVSSTLYVIGGWHSQPGLNPVCQDEIAYLNFDSLVWYRYRLKFGEFPARSKHASCTNGGAVCIHGGFSADRSLLSDLWVLNCEGELDLQKQRTTGNAPPAVAGHTLDCLHHKLYLFGGIRSNGELSNSLHMIDLEGLVWTPVILALNSPAPRLERKGVSAASTSLNSAPYQESSSSIIPTCRAYHQSFVEDGKLRLLGGKAADKESFNKDVTTAGNWCTDIPQYDPAQITKGMLQAHFLSADLSHGITGARWTTTQLEGGDIAHRTEGKMTKCLHGYCITRVGNIIYLIAGVDANFAANSPAIYMIDVENMQMKKIPWTDTSEMRLPSGIPMKSHHETHWHCGDGGLVAEYLVLEGSRCTPYKNGGGTTPYPTKDKPHRIMIIGGKAVQNGRMLKQLKVMSIWASPTTTKSPLLRRKSTFTAVAMLHSLVRRRSEAHVQVAKNEHSQDELSEASSEGQNNVTSRMLRRSTLLPTTMAIDLESCEVTTDAIHFRQHQPAQGVPGESSDSDSFTTGTATEVPDDTFTMTPTHRGILESKLIGNLKRGDTNRSFHKHNRRFTHFMLPEDEKITVSSDTTTDTQTIMLERQSSQLTEANSEMSADSTERPTLHDDQDTDSGSDELLLELQQTLDELETKGDIPAFEQHQSLDDTFYDGQSIDKLYKQAQSDLGTLGCGVLPTTIDTTLLAMATALTLSPHPRRASPFNKVGKLEDSKEDWQHAMWANKEGFANLAIVGKPLSLPPHHGDDNKHRTLQVNKTAMLHDINLLVKKPQPGKTSPSYQLYVEDTPQQQVVEVVERDPDPIDLNEMEVFGMCPVIGDKNNVTKFALVSYPKLMNPSITLPSKAVLADTALHGPAGELPVTNVSLKWRNANKKKGQQQQQQQQQQYGLTTTNNSLSRPMSAATATSSGTSASTTTTHKSTTMFTAGQATILKTEKRCISPAVVLPHTDEHHSNITPDWDSPSHATSEESPDEQATQQQQVQPRRRYISLATAIPMDLRTTCASYINHINDKIPRIHPSVATELRAKLKSRRRDYEELAERAQQKQQKKYRHTRNVQQSVVELVQDKARGKEAPEYAAKRAEDRAKNYVLRTTGFPDITPSKKSDLTWSAHVRKPRPVDQLMRPQPLKPHVVALKNLPPGMAVVEYCARVKGLHQRDRDRRLPTIPNQ